MRQRQWVALVAGCVLLAGCATPAGGGSDPVLLQRTSPDPGLLASLTAELAVKDGCLALVGPEGNTLLPVFPPSAATWVDGELELEDERYSLGETITMAGGLVDAGDPSGQFSDLGIPEACAEFQLWSVTAAG